MQLLRLLAVISMTAYAQAKPAWVSDDTVKRTGDIVVVTCEAADVSKDLAYSAALRRCNALAAEQVKSSNFHVKSIALNTESEAHLYEQVASHWQVEGLKPKTLREFTERLGDEFKSALQVRYDLRDVTLKDISVLDETPDSEAIKSTLTVEHSERESPSLVTKKHFTQSSQRSIVVTTIPPCLNIMIDGQVPRTITCKNNPQLISYDSNTDKELIITAKGYQKRITIQKDRKPSDFHETESLEVTLDPL